MVSRFLLSLLLVTVSLGASAEAQPRNVIVQFMAPDANWAGITGHAFICIELKTASGPSEECFGFYSRKSGKALVGGPGVADREFDFSKTPPRRFTQVKASLTTPITASRRQRLLTYIRGFDKDFSLTPANCISFANGVAKLAGLKTPPSTSLTPVEYLNELRKLNSARPTASQRAPQLVQIIACPPVPRSRAVTTPSASMRTILSETRGHAAAQDTRNDDLPSRVAFPP